MGSLLRVLGVGWTASGTRGRDDKIEGRGELRVGPDAVEAIELLQCAGLAELCHAEVDAGDASDRREERERVRVSVEHRDDRRRTVGGEELVDDRRIAGTGIA